MCGLGRIGFRAFELLHALREQVAVVTAAAREDWLVLARDACVTTIMGDVRSSANLEAAGMGTAKAIIAATDEDAVNIEIALDARNMRRDLPIVVRLFDRDLGDLIEQRVGVRRALGSSALAAPIFAYAALGEHILARLEYDGRPHVVCRISPDAPTVRGLTAREIERRHHVSVIDVNPGAVTVFAERSRYHELRGIVTPSEPATRARRAPIAWRTVREVWVNAPQGLRTIFGILFGLIVLSVLVFGLAQPLGLVDAIYYVITTVTTVGYGDITPKEVGAALKLFACLLMLMGSITMAVLYSFATDFVVNERFRGLLGRPRIPEEGHIIVVGIGNIGYRVVDELLAAGRQVVAVDLTIEGQLASTLGSRCPVIAGDGRVATTMEAANMAGAGAVVATTGDDAANLAIGLHARRRAPRSRIVVRLFDTDLARKVEGGGLVDNALSPSLLAAPTFVAAALYGGVRAAFMDDAGLCVVHARTVPPEWDGMTAAEVRNVRGVQALMRDADERLRAGDQILCAVRRA